VRDPQERQCTWRSEPSRMSYIRSTRCVDVPCRAFMSTCQWPSGPLVPPNRKLVQASSPRFGSWWGHLIWRIYTAVTGGLSYLRHPVHLVCTCHLLCLQSCAAVPFCTSVSEGSERPYRFILAASFQSRLQLQRRQARSKSVETM
jgi:hypothetical protein